MGATNNKSNTIVNDESGINDAVNHDAKQSSNENNGSDAATNDTSAGEPVPIARGRGRPKKSDTTTTGNNTGKFNREKRSERSEPKSNKGVDVKKLAKQLRGVHMGLSMVTKNHIYILEESESEDLAAAIKEVMSHHEVVINPRLMAYGELIAVAASIYVPRVIININNASKNKPPKSVVNNPVVNVQPQAQPTGDLNKPAGVYQYQ